MTDAHARAVDAAEGWYQYQTSSSREDAWYFANGIITAYLDSMRAAGWVMVRVPDEVEPRFQRHQQWVDGFNLCRKLTMDSAAMLKGAGDEQG